MGSLWGIIPAAGRGSRIQPLAFSKELLPVGSYLDGDKERPKAVSEYLLDRMAEAGARKACMVISPWKSDIMEYYGKGTDYIDLCYVVQQAPKGLCDAIFAARHLISEDDHVLVGLPDTIWFPSNALENLPSGILSFLLFPSSQPELFDAVMTDEFDHITEIRVKQPGPIDSWIWGAFKLPGWILHQLFEIWDSTGRRHEYFGSLVTEYIDQGGTAKGIRAGHSYVDVGTLHGYRKALELLSGEYAPVEYSSLKPVAVE